MRFSVLTLFPEMFRGPFEASMIASALDSGIIDISVVDIRDFATDKHRTADDYPFGGGSGMILKPEPVFRAVESVVETGGRDTASVVLLSPQGRRFSQDVARELSRLGHIVLICGHYKGVDERIRDRLAGDEISIGDYVVTGGELAAMVVIDAVTRLLPGVLGDFASAETDSFYGGLLECGQYTRPRDFRGYKVPDILFSGNHEAIRRWRRRDSLRKTALHRPDLLKKVDLNEEDKVLLSEIEDQRESQLNNA